MRGVGDHDEHGVAPPLRFERVSLARDGRPVLDEVSFVVPARGVTVILGPSGTGKSTAARLMNRLEVADQGRVLLRGRDVAAMDPLEVRRRVGLVLQRPVVFGGSVRDNLLVADGDATAGELAAAMDRVHLDPGLIARPADTLSGGEAQRLCMARTLLLQPEILVADEATSSVDPATRRALEALTVDLAAEGIPVVWITHDLDQMRRIADHVVVILGGRVAYSGRADQLDTTGDRAVRRFLAAESQEDTEQPDEEDRDDGRGTHHGEGWQ